MDIKLVAIDMDGTFLDDLCKIPERNLMAVKKAIKKGVIIVPTTGRSFRNVKAELFKEVTGINYCITANGTIVAEMEKERILAAEVIPVPQGKLVYQMAKKYSAYLELYSGLEAYMDARGIEYLWQAGLTPEYCEQLMGTNIKADNLDQLVLEEELPISKFHIVCTARAEKEQLKKEIAALGGMFPISVISKNIELVSGTYSKRNGLEQLISALGIAKNQVLVIGDSNNDYEMIKWADHSVAMGNANDRIKEAALHITASNNQAGVADALEKYLNLE